MNMISKLSILFFVLLAFGFITGDTYKIEGEKHLANIKMLTEEGENAEAYFSFDDKKLIFQAKFGDMKCDQIFTMNIDGSDKKMVSTGPRCRPSSSASRSWPSISTGPGTTRRSTSSGGWTPSSGSRPVTTPSACWAGSVRSASCGRPGTRPSSPTWIACTGTSRPI